MGNFPKANTQQAAELDLDIGVPDRKDSLPQEDFKTLTLIYQIFRNFTSNRPQANSPNFWTQGLLLLRSIGICLSAEELGETMYVRVPSA